MNIRLIGSVLLLTLVAAICAVLPVAQRTLSSEQKPGDACLKVVQKVSQTPVLHTTLCIPDIGGGN
jgi:hypothetical protein